MIMSKSKLINHNNNDRVGENLFHLARRRCVAMLPSREWSASRDSTRAKARTLSSEFELYRRRHCCCCCRRRANEPEQEFFALYIFIRRVGSLLCRCDHAVWLSSDGYQSSARVRRDQLIRGPLICALGSHFTWPASWVRL